MRRDARLSVVECCAVIVLGVYLAAVGVNVLTLGDVVYANYLHWPVAAPIALAIGIVLVVVGLRLRPHSR
jgi:hypothetical protein